MANPAAKRKRESRSELVLLDDLPGVASRFAKTLKSGDVVCLSGPIGAGKTTFVFFVLKALGLAKGAAFSSPTFTVLNRYRTKSFVVNHADLYRLENYGELESLDVVASLEDAGALGFVEWGEKFPELGGLFTKRVRFEHVKGDTLERFLTFEDL